MYYMSSQRDHISIRDGNERIKTGSTFYTRVKIHPHPTIISLVDGHDASVVKTKSFISSPYYTPTGELLRRSREFEEVRIGIRERVGERAGEDRTGAWETWSDKIGTRKGCFFVF